MSDGPLLAQYLLIYCDRPGYHRLQAELTLYAEPARRTKPRPQFSIVEQLIQGGCQRIGVGRGNRESSLAMQRHKWDSGLKAGVHYWYTVRHSFDLNDAKGLDDTNVTAATIRQIKIADSAAIEPVRTNSNNPANAFEILMAKSNRLQALPPLPMCKELNVNANRLTYLPNLPECERINEDAR